VTEYDKLGRRISETDQAGLTTQFEYDALGRLVKVIDALLQETVYSYDEQGNRITQTDANLHTTRFEYDALGRQTARELPDGSRESMTYDAAGNLESRTDFNGVTTTYDYDENNRLTSRNYPDAGQNVAFTYTSMGRRETATDVRGTTSYTYDVRDRIETVTYPDGRTLTYGYDTQGNRTSLTANIGGQTLTTSYSYDELNRLDIVTDSESRIYDHDYDENGNRQFLAHPNGVNTDYVYDDLNRLTDLTTIGPAGTVQSYHFTLGAAGNREQIDEADGTIRGYAYDDLYRLLGETVTDGTSASLYSKSFVYDNVGNRLTQTTVGSGAAGTPLEPGTIDYLYDTRDRIATVDGQAYTWDANGNLTAKPDGSTYAWDFDNRLTQVTLADGTTVEHVYDVDGNRVQTTTTPAGGTAGTTNFLVDTSGGLSHVVAETDAEGNLIAQHVRGDDLLAVIRPSETRFFHADGLGSIRALTDDLGNVTDTYEYSAFGELVSHVGADSQPFAFAGQRLDPVTGLQYHTARWMNSKTGMFVSMDPFAGMLFEPQSLHRYTYAANDPVNRIDPSGQMSLVTVSVSLGILNTIAAGTMAHLRGYSTGESILIGLGAGATTVIVVYGGSLLLEAAWVAAAAAAAAAAGGGVLVGPYGQVTRAALEKAAQTQGPTITVFTRLSQSPAANRALSVATDPALAAKVTDAATRQLYSGQVPLDLVLKLERVGLAVRSITMMGGQIGEEIRFAPTATEYIIRFLTVAK
jgi:RHS repeat-associated protein